MLRALEINFLNMSNVQYLPGFRKFEFGLCPLQLTTAVLRLSFQAENEIRRQISFYRQVLQAKLN